MSLLVFPKIALSGKYLNIKLFEYFMKMVISSSEICEHKLKDSCYPCLPPSLSLLPS